MGNIKPELYHTIDECDSNNLPSRNFNPRFHEDRLPSKDTKMTKFLLFLFACFVGNIINLILQSDSYKILGYCNALILNTSKYMCRSKDMYPNHRTAFFMFAALFQKHLFKTLSFILSVSICLSSQITTAVSMRSNVYQTSSKNIAQRCGLKTGN